ncbi:unnamed protein product [Nezara viridula]|uniref:Uncharacterized protein n=1 Tax=Nezara viridula TaxID=85310 RepID=A0A9P0EFS0_NEZVI|nr:unnamed protein product [Nezara viridula]
MFSFSEGEPSASSSRNPRKGMFNRNYGKTPAAKLYEAVTVKQQYEGEPSASSSRNPRKGMFNRNYGKTPAAKLYEAVTVKQQYEGEPSASSSRNPRKGMFNRKDNFIATPSRVDGLDNRLSVNEHSVEDLIDTLSNIIKSEGEPSARSSRNPRKGMGNRKDYFIATPSRVDGLVNRLSVNERSVEDLIDTLSNIIKRGGIRRLFSDRPRSPAHYIVLDDPPVTIRLRMDPFRAGLVENSRLIFGWPVSPQFLLPAATGLIRFDITRINVGGPTAAGCIFETRVVGWNVTGDVRGGGMRGEGCRKG